MATSKDTPIIRMRSRTARTLITTLCVAILIAAGGLAVLSYLQVSQTNEAEFNRSATQANEVLVSKLNNFNDLLYTGRGLLQNSQAVTQSEWTGFFEEQDVFSRYQGISSIIYVKTVSNEQKQSFLELIREDDDFKDFVINPDGERDRYGLPTLIASENDTTGVVGSDVFIDPVRKAVYDMAAQERKPIASPPLKFKTGFPGFFVVLSNVYNAQLDGFILISFRTNDLMPTILSNENKDFRYKIDDVGDNGSTLYTSPGWNENNSQSFVSYANVGSRNWRVTIASTQKAPEFGAIYGVPLTILVVAFLFISAILFAEHRIFSRPSR